MKIRIAVALCVFSICGMGVNGLLMAEQSAGDKSGSESDIRKYSDHASDYRKRADKARAEGKSDLADVLMKCADANQKISEACKSGNKGDLTAALQEYSEAEKALSAQEEIEKSSARDRAAKLKDAAGKYEKAAKDFEQKAGEIGDDDPLSPIYNKLASAYHKVAEGYKTGDQNLVNTGFDEYRSAQKERDRLNKLKEKKKVKKTVLPEEKSVAPSVVPASETATVAPSGKSTGKLPEYKLD